MRGRWHIGETGGFYANQRKPRFSETFIVRRMMWLDGMVSDAWELLHRRRAPELLGLAPGATAEGPLRAASLPCPAQGPASHSPPYQQFPIPPDNMRAASKHTQAAAPRDVVPTCMAAQCDNRLRKMSLPALKRGKRQQPVLAIIKAVRLCTCRKCGHGSA